jgi:N-acetylglucosaminyl-diphospho-decaprenol L-rhamnosyltransferase
MLLSVIIVNYNVKHFLEQCLCSVKKALDLGAALNSKVTPFAEVLVVDNHSADGSIQYLQPLFPFVNFISNKKNEGFAKANNRALQQARGRYVLFLNPDTILPEDVFQKTIAFMEAHTDAGMLGVQMVDGAGRFLKESRRGLPTAWASFCKMSGLAALLPSSPIFARYYMGHLDKGSTHAADVLAGAFMLARKKVLDKVGGFDEQFFMYAEDIDLSYRVTQAGYKNYYFADATIIHFKGESTRKDARYVKLFYKAMRQFVKKHYRSGGGLLYAGMLNAAIRLRSGLSLLRPFAGNHQPQPIATVALKGDADTIKQLRLLLRQNSISIQPGSNTIIFCEGKSCPFHDIIALVQKLGPHQNALIHAGNSNSIVGSWDKNQQGVTVEVKS